MQNTNEPQKHYAKKKIMLHEKKPDMKDHTLYVSIYRKLLFIRKCLEKEIFYKDSRFLFAGSRK